MIDKYQYVFHIGSEVVKDKLLFQNMNTISYEYDFLKEKDVLQFLDKSSIICCMLRDDKLLGFSWVVLCEEQQIAELCWFVMDKHKTKGLEGKLLLDKTIEYCKNHNITSLKFNCDSQSWGRIKNKNKLLSSYGYKLTENEEDYDISIDI